MTFLALTPIEQAGVAITPGIDFGANAPERPVRSPTPIPSSGFSQEGVRRIGELLRARKNRYIRGCMSAYGYIYAPELVYADIWV